VRNGDVLVPGYDVEGKLWTIQYMNEDGTKRFAKNSRKHGCLHVVGAPNGAVALQQIAMSPVVVIAEGYATAVTLAKHGKVPTLAAYDSGNLLSVATALPGQSEAGNRQRARATIENSTLGTSSIAFPYYST
jgi:phage/plasmid primase-like uncharacterized protein